MENKNEIMANGGAADKRNTLRISVAMATYNGEKYIEEQLLSICRQTRRVDEIVISDDGSKDKTLDIVRRVVQSEDARGIDFVVLTDNPRHGCCGNFAWAISHTTGDLIFLSDQDDVWLPEKVERICYVKAKHPEMLCIVHNASMIDANNTPIYGAFHEVIKLDTLPTDSDNVVHIERDTFLESVTSAVLANGMVMCIDRELLDTVFPFPQTSGSHDNWIGFCAVCENKCIYLSEKLAQYRLHDSNTCGNSSRKIKLIPKIKRIIRRIKSGESSIQERFYLGEAILEHLEKHNLSSDIAYKTALRVYEIGRAQMEAFQFGGIRGAIMLVKLFCKDIRYRRSGGTDFLYQLCAVLLNRT